MAGSEMCNILRNYCESGSYNASSYCNGEYDCLQRNDEDLHFCPVTKNNALKAKIEEMNTAYNR